MESLSLSKYIRSGSVFIALICLMLMNATCTKEPCAECEACTDCEACEEIDQIDALFKSLPNPEFGGTALLNGQYWESNRSSFERQPGSENLYRISIHREVFLEKVMWVFNQIIFFKNVNLSVGDTTFLKPDDNDVVPTANFILGLYDILDEFYELDEEKGDSNWLLIHEIESEKGIIYGETQVHFVEEGAEDVSIINCHFKAKFK